MFVMVEQKKRNVICPSKMRSQFMSQTGCMCSGSSQTKVVNRPRKSLRSEILDWECQGPDLQLVHKKAAQLKLLKSFQRKQDKINKNLQKAKDVAVLKAWRQMFRRQSHDSVWNSKPKELRPGAATYTLSKEPFGSGMSTNAQCSND